jgi:diacylglycerol kinase (ATP)
VSVPKPTDTGVVLEEDRGFSVLGRARSFGHAFRGIAIALRTQHNLWIHSAATLAVCGLGWWTGVSALEWCALVFAIAIVWVAELLNTAFEFLCDAVSPEPHPLIGKAKDVSAGAVLVGAILAAVVAVIIFAPRLASLAGC